MSEIRALENPPLVTFNLPKVVKLLLKHPKVDPSSFSNFAIRFAAENGHDGVVELLLRDSRVDPAAQMNSAIIEASRNGHSKVRKKTTAEF